MKEESELTFGETIKKPFQKLKDVEKKIHELVNTNFVSKCEGCYKDKTFTIIVNNTTFRSTSTQWADAFSAVVKQIEGWKLKQTDPHADIKAEYEKAIADGKIVKVFRDSAFSEGMHEMKSPVFAKDYIYELRYYEIDWNKLLSWSYANCEFVECEFVDNVGAVWRKYKLVGISKLNYITDNDNGFRYCRLAKGVEIKDEWLKEIKLTHSQ